MKHTKLIFVAIALLCTCLARGQTNFTYSSGTLNATIPDGNPTGFSSVANFSGLPGFITSIQVNLDITGGFNGDLYAYLVGPGGQAAFLLNRVGVTSGNGLGYSDTGFNITLDSSGTFANIHNYQSGSHTLNGGGQLTGTWAPDGRNIDPQSAPSLFDTASTAHDLSLFNGTIPNGEWTLFLADVSGGNTSTLVNWGLTIVTVPEPQTWAMVAGGVGMLLVLSRRSRR